MAGLTDQQVDIIARRALQRLSQSASSPTQAVPPVPVACGDAHRLPTSPAPSCTVGIYAGVDAAVQAATEAFHCFQAMPLAGRAKIIAGIREKMMASAELLAREAHAETGLGRWQDKVLKNRLVTRKTPGTEDLTPIATTGDHGLMLMERAPFGVIASITPSTNPTSTIICNTI